MSDLTNWATSEIEIIKNKFPDDGYGNLCRDSALRAFKAAYTELEKDGHSGYSWNCTINILKALLDGKPLSPITEDDFGSCGNCHRYSGLFKKEDGSYNDIYRVSVHEMLSNTYWISSTIHLDEFIPPITMPYTPEKWVVHQVEFTWDGEKCEIIPGEYNAIQVISITKPDGHDILVGKYYVESYRGMIEVTKEDEFDALNTAFCKMMDEIHQEAEDK